MPELIGRCLAAATVLFIVAVVVSCGPRQPVVTVRDGMDYAEMSDADVLAVVNNRMLSKKDVESELLLRMALFRIRFPKVDDVKIAKFRKKERSRIISSFCERELFRQLAEQSGGFVDENIERRISVGYAKMLSGGRLEDFDSALTLSKAVSPREKALLREEKKIDVLVESLLWRNNSADLMVSNAEISNALVRIERGRALAMSTNQIIKAKIEDIRKEAVAGADFSALAERYSQEMPLRPGGFLGACGESDFAYIEGYWDAVKDLIPGGVSSIFDTGASYDVVKCIGVQNGQKTYSRIMLLKAQAFEDSSPEKIRENFAREKRQMVIRRVVQKALLDNRVIPPPKKITFK